MTQELFIAFMLLNELVIDFGDVKHREALDLIEKEFKDDNKTNESL